jgi:hypothetical protein
VPVVAEEERVRRSRQEYQLPVRVGQLSEELEQILLAGDPLMLRRAIMTGTSTFSGLRTGRLAVHVEVGFGRDLVAEHELGVGQRLGALESGSFGRGTEGSNPCTLQGGYWLVGIVDWPDRAGLPGVALESPCFEHLERTCAPAGRPRRKSRGRLRLERQYRD